MLTRLAAYLTNLRRRRRAGAEAEDELAFHIEMATQAGVEAGLSPEEARRQALRELGSVAAVRDGVYDARAMWFDSLWQDVRFSLATLRRSPAFVVTAVLVLGLGIGVDAAVFSIVDALFLRPPPVESPDRLVYLYQKLPQSGLWVTDHEQFEYFARHSDAFAAMTTHWSRGATITIGDESRTVQGETVDANYFDLLGVKPSLGRTFVPADDDLGSTEFSVVISDDFWARHFKRDRTVIGRSIRLQNQPFTIVGITPRGFRGISDPWSPSEYWATNVQMYGPAWRRLGVGLIGRLKPGVSVQQAQANISVLNDQVWQERQARIAGMRGTYIRNPLLPAHMAANTAVVLPMLAVRTPFFPEAEIIPIRLATSIAVVVALVLLIAAANIAGLLSARALSRTHEVAVRRALGAGTARLVRQLTIEGLMLSLAGGFLGLVLARWLMDLYRAYTPERYVVDVALNPAVAVFAFALCVIVGVAVGLAPALQALRVDVLRVLGGASGPTVRGRRRLRHGVVVPQVVAAIVLLFVAGVHLRSLAPMETTNTGFSSTGVTVMNVGIIDERRTFALQSRDDDARQAERQRHFLLELTNRLGGLSATDAVALSDYLPTSRRVESSSVVSRDGADGGSQSSVFQTAISARFFATLNLPLREGRDFDARDARESPHVAIISDSVSSRLWPGRSAVGRELGLPDRNGVVQDWLTVVGVVADTSHALQPGVAIPALYVPLSQQWRPSPSNLIARLTGGSTTIATLRGAVVTADPDAAVYRVQLLSQVVNEMLYPRRAAAWILAVSGVAGLFLATIGLYGVVSHSVVQRTREISIRMTVGADKRDVVGLVLREGVWVAALGAVAGLPLSVWALRVTANLVGPMPTFDWLVAFVVPTIVVAVVLVACYVPARRAANADPASVLRGL